MELSENQRLCSRRSFCIDTVKAAGAGVLVSGLPLSVSAFAGGNDEIKVALVGCGGRGTGAAAQAMQADEGVRLVAMADIFPDRLESSFEGLSAKFNDKVKAGSSGRFLGFDAYKKAIDMADVVILATPPGFRPQHFEYAVNSGKHVFMEKPLATDVMGIKRIMDAARVARNKKLNVVVGLQRHYQRSYREIFNKLGAGSAGEIVAGQVYWNSAGVWVKPRKPEYTELEYQLRNWYYFNWICGDHILEQHIHNIDVANWYIGTHPVSAQGMGGREVRTGKEYGHIFDHHFVEFTYPDGQVIASQCRHQPGCFNRVEEIFQTTSGSIRVNSDNTGVIMGRGGKIVYDHDGKGDVNPYQQEHNELFAAVRAGEYRLDDTEYGAQSTMTAILGRMATYSGQFITWDEALSTNLDLVPEISDFNSKAPVMPDDEGFYPVPVPGVSKYKM
jgi:predicted dehydrogenase